ILRAAANGDLDVVITHAPALEQRLLVGPGHALLRCPLAASRFAVVGPAADPAGVATAATAAEAFRRIAGAGGPFVSRGDSSGAAARRAGRRDVGDTRRARGGARAAAAGRYAGVRAAARRLRSYCEIVREYPVSGRSWKSDPATASMVATYWLSFRVSATPIV